ncbi:MAG: dihydrofolate reductase family protein [Ignavibacteriaceae bacterium]
MRKVVTQFMISIDGFFEGPTREIDWHNVDAELHNDVEEMLKNADILLFGRVTYEMMAKYWPTEYAVTNDAVIANYMNSLPKIVFSKTLLDASWNNTKVVKENVEGVIRELKQQPGNGIILLGSSDLAITLIPPGLIDEFRIIVNPVILGNGKSLFNGINKKYKLRLIKSRTFNSGNVLLNYKPADN